MILCRETGYVLASGPEGLCKCPPDKCLTAAEQAIVRPESYVEEIKRKVAEAEEYRKTSEVEVLRVTLFSMQVCAPAKLTADEVQEQANKCIVAGTEDGWKIRTIQEATVCANDKYRRHWLLDC